MHIFSLSHRTERDAISVHLFYQPMAAQPQRLAEYRFAHLEKVSELAKIISVLENGFVFDCLG
jgi:hypothetical protein